VFLNAEVLIPPAKIDDYFISFGDGTTVSGNAIVRGKASKSRTLLPRMGKLMEWGIVQKGMILSIKNYDVSEAVVQDAKTVRFKDENMTFNDWGQKVTDWSSICIYDWATTSDGHTHSELRAKRMAEEATKGADSDEVGHAFQFEAGH
jgi:hypothetical protein